MAQTYDAAIIGAGIVGAACAYELSRAGLRVGVVEERGIGTGATNAGMGHLVVLDASPEQFALTRYSLELWRELAGELPAECDYWRCGTLWVAADEEQLAHAREKCVRYQRDGVRAELVDSRQVHELEPNLREGLSGGLLVPDDAAVHPASVARFLVEQSKAELVTRRAVAVQSGNLRLDDGSTISAGAIINATGTAAAELTPGLPIRARKGQILVADPGTGFARHQVVELGYVTSTHADEQDAIAFNVRQNRNGELLMGASRQYKIDPEVDGGVIDQLFARAVEYMPKLASARRVRSWAGFRASTPDGLPLIGRFEGVYVATGHEGLGATTSLATARLIAAEILGERPEIDGAPYHPRR
jgi:D-hydroxyproline dehydrogenase subunit beta